MRARPYGGYKRSNGCQIFRKVNYVPKSLMEPIVVEIAILPKIH